MNAASTKEVRLPDGTEIDFYCEGKELIPHGYELRGPNCTNTTGRFSTGELTFNGKMLVDFDGSFELPVEVCDALESLGYTLDEFIRPDAKVESRENDPAWQSENRLRLQEAGLTSWDESEPYEGDV